MRLRRGESLRQPRTPHFCSVAAPCTGPRATLAWAGACPVSLSDGNAYRAGAPVHPAARLAHAKQIAHCASGAPRFFPGDDLKRALLLRSEGASVDDVGGWGEGEGGAVVGAEAGEQGERLAGVGSNARGLAGAEAVL